MGEMTLREASKRAKEQGRSLGISYLNRMAREHPERLGARFVELPTGIGYYLIDEDKLLEYIASAKPRPGRKRPKTEGEA